SVTSSNAALTIVTVPIITAQTPQPLRQVVATNASFTNSVAAACDASCGPLGYQWKLNGNVLANATNSSYINPSATSAAEGAYSAGVSNAAGTNLASGWQVIVTSGGRLVGWGDNSQSQADCPGTISNAVSISVGDLHCLAALEDGTVRAWGYNGSGQTNVPSG